MRLPTHMPTKKSRQNVSAEGFWLFRGPCQNLRGAHYCTACFLKDGWRKKGLRQ
jgi:hypothetical protein